MGDVISIGIDIVDLERVRKLCADGNRSFAERICTAKELEYCYKHSDPAPSLAARFAAKEAVAKALGTGIGAHCSFQEVEVTSLPSGVPQLTLHGSAAQTACEMGITRWMLSLTHSRLSAAAVVIAKD